MIRYLPRTVLTYLVGVLATMAASLAVVILARLDPTGPLMDRVTVWWSRAWLKAAGCSVEMRGSRVESDRSYVVVANHSSTLDIMVCFLAVRLPIRYLAKRELFRVPVLAPAMRALGIVSVDRQARNAVHDQINAQAHQLVATGRSLIIYPEGTRSEGLAPFKKGAFTIAIAAQLPVLPVSIHGTYRAWAPSSLWVRGGPIGVIVDDPIETAGMTQADSTRLSAQTHAIIEKRLIEMADQS